MADGRWAAFEAKLGQDEVESAAEFHGQDLQKGHAPQDEDAPRSPPTCLPVTSEAGGSGGSEEQQERIPVGDRRAVGGLPGDSGAEAGLDSGREPVTQHAGNLAE
jgi:hypothetical protein